MASQPPAVSKTSRWGSFLTGIESKLDTILADEDSAAKHAMRNDSNVHEQPNNKDGATTLAMGAGSSSRTPSTNRAQDRLGEKLARAMANKNPGQKGENMSSSLAASGEPSRSNSPANVKINPGGSADMEGSHTVEPSTHGDQGEVNNDMLEYDKDQIVVAPHSIDPHAFTQKSLETAETTDEDASNSRLLNGSNPPKDSRSLNEYQETIAQLRSDNEAAELRRQEEVYEYVEKIDALQSKLQYLTKEAADIAKTTMETKPGSSEQKLAAKDEKIALLIEEGLKLSQIELKHMNVIKKLRNKSNEDDRSLADFKQTLEKHEKAAREAQDRAKRAENADKKASEKLKILVKLEKDLESMSAQRDAQDSLIHDLRLQLSALASTAKDAELKTNAETLDIERRRAVDLTEELSNIKMEKEVAEKENQNMLRELREKSERERERARVAEIERQGEHSILESRLEAYRNRAEEVSAGQGGDIQAKLLRQIETLQNQYAVASENWQGIETSLLSRVTVLEKERNEIAKREGDIRRKARETVTKSRRMEEDLEQASAKAHDLESELSSRSSLLSALQDRVVRVEAESLTAQNDLKAERQAWEARQATRLEEERSRIREESFRSYPDSSTQIKRTESPTIYNRTRKSSNTDRNSPRNSRRIQGLAILGASHDRPSSRPSSSHRIMPGSSDAYQTQKTERQSSWDFQAQNSERKDSMSIIPQLSVNNGIPETPSIDNINEEDFFAGIHTPGTPPDRTINEIVSVSTAGAGPSVQLVERMSAAIRRLESEKAAHKDELTRLFGQRDETREQVVELMRDNEDKKAADEKVKKLETELKIVQERYLTTLEMLGEKSERVEELRADVDDLKVMYRELVDNTMR